MKVAVDEGGGSLVGKPEAVLWVKIEYPDEWPGRIPRTAGYEKPG